MNIQKMCLSDLKPADYNPRVDLEAGMPEYEKLKKSLEEFGFIDPPIFNKQTGNLVGGHQRVAVAKKINLCDEVEVSIVDLPIDKEKALNLALNRISGIWDEEKLGQIINELEIDSELLSLAGFDKEETDELLKKILDDDTNIYTSIPDEVVPLETFALNVIVSNESEQAKLYDELIERGFDVKVVTL